MAEYSFTWPSNPSENDTVIYDDRLWIFDGTKWVLQGSAAFVPVKGDKGLTGDTGPAGPQGPIGAQGIQGDQGIQGPAGTGLNFKGYLAAVGNLPANGNTEGDAYVVGTSGTTEVYAWLDDNGGLAWVNLGPISGPTGAPGQDGQDGSPGEQGPQGEVRVKDTIGAPVRGDRGEMFIDQNNVIYVTTGR